MSTEDFTNYKINEEWESDSDCSDGKGEFEVITFRKLSHHAIAACLKQAAKICVRRLNNILNVIANDDKTECQNDMEALHQWRVLRSRSLIDGQLRLLNLLLDQVKE